MCMIIKTVNEFGTTGECVLFSVDAHKEEFGSWDAHRRKQVCYVKCSMQYSLDLSISFAFRYV